MPSLTWSGKGAPPRPRGTPLREIERFGLGARETSPGRLISGAAEEVLPSLRPELEGRVDLVYLDPPFATGGSFDHLVTLPGHPERLRVPAYRDAADLDAWLGWFHGVATELHALLADGGSLYVHLDAHAAHYAKVLLDEVFGARSFQREIVWRIGWVSGFKSRARSWIRNHDTILFYAKGDAPKTFHKAYAPYPPGYVRRDGAPPKGRGVPLDDVWNASEADRLDSIQIMSFSGEKVGYPTQKNEALVARILEASSSPGDLVLDACAGSGTTAVVASRLGRRWIACDASPVALHVIRRRLRTLRPPASFVLEAVGAPHPAGRLEVRAVRKGRAVRLALTGYAGRKPGGLAAIEGIAVQWHRTGDGFQPDVERWRDRRGGLLEVELDHVFPRAGAYRIAVRAYDAFGDFAEAEVSLRVPRG